MSKLKARRSVYNDCWKQFLKNLIMSIDYFKKCKPNTIEELLYSLREEYIESNKVIYKAGDSVECIKFVSSGVFQLIIRFDNGTEIVMDHLRQGCSFGMYSILEPSPVMFQIKAKTHMVVQCLDFEVLENLRKTHPDLDKEMTEYEDYIEEYGLPICDYTIPYHTGIKLKFKNAVRRVICLNEYKHKKKSKLTKLIIDLKKQKEEWEAKGVRKVKREEFKQELATLIYDKIKDIIPNK